MLRLRKPPQICHHEIELARQVDSLHATAFVHLEARAQNLVPLQQPIEAAPQRLQIQLSLHLDEATQVIDRPRLPQLLQKPQPLLRK